LDDEKPLRLDSEEERHTQWLVLSYSKRCWALDDQPATLASPCYGTPIQTRAMSGDRGPYALQSLTAILANSFNSSSLFILSSSKRLPPFRPLQQIYRFETSLPGFSAQFTGIIDGTGYKVRVQAITKLTRNGNPENRFATSTRTRKGANVVTRASDINFLRDKFAILT